MPHPKALGNPTRPADAAMASLDEIRFDALQRS
jgi:hypothetical protein